MTKTTPSKAPRAIGRVFVAAFLAVLIAAAAAGAFFWHEGYRLYAVRTGSMSPTFPTGTLLVDRPADQDLPAIGRVITFRVNGELVTHRVHGVTSQGLTTKGDANDSPDAWTIGQRLVVGTVAAGIARGGYVLVFLQQPTGIPALALFAVSVALAWTLFFGSAAKPDGPDTEVADGVAGAEDGGRRVPWPSVTATSVVLLLLGSAAVALTLTISAATQPTSAYVTSSRSMSLAFSLCSDHHRGHGRPAHPGCSTDDRHTAYHSAEAPMDRVPSAAAPASRAPLEPETPSSAGTLLPDLPSLGTGIGPVTADPTAVSTRLTRP